MFCKKLSLEKGAKRVNVALLTKQPQARWQDYFIWFLLRWKTCSSRFSLVTLRWIFLKIQATMCLVDSWTTVLHLTFIKKYLRMKNCFEKKTKKTNPWNVSLVLDFAACQRKDVLSFSDGVPVEANRLFLKCQMKWCNLFQKVKHNKRSLYCTNLSAWQSVWPHQQEINLPGNWQENDKDIKRKNAVLS